MFCKRAIVKNRKKWETMRIWTKTAFIVLFINYITLLAAAIEPIASTVLDSTIPNREEILAFVVARTVILLVILVFQMVHAYYGLFRDNIYELYATMITQVSITIIVTLRTIFTVIATGWDLYTILLFVQVATFQVIFLIYAYPLYSEYRYTFFELAGADHAYRTRFRKYLKIQALLKIDLMLGIITGVTLAVASNSDTSQIDLAPLITTIVVSCFAVIYYCFGKIGAKEENKTYMYLYWGFSFVSPAYIGYSLYVIASKGILSKILDLENLPQESNNKIIFSFFFLGSAFMLLIIRALSLVYSYLVFKNFGTGVKNREYVKVGIKSDSSDDNKENFNVNDVIYNTIMGRKEDE